MVKGSIRPVAICLCSRDGAILVFEEYDTVKQQVYYRPLGGGIEFGELGAETVRRELREEIGAEVQDVRYVGALENIFTCEGEAGHEIVMVYDGRLTDASLYEKEVIHGREEEANLSFLAYWRPLAGFAAPGSPPLYPDGLLEMISPT